MEYITSVILALFGWWVVHRLNAQRDVLNKRRDLRVGYLLEAYRKLEGASNRHPSEERYSDIESAIADIQLLGTPKQVKLARDFTNNFAHEGKAFLDELLQEIRNDLRQELRLEPDNSRIQYLRISQQKSKEYK